MNKFKKKWREEGNIVYFSITSNGTTGTEWITRLKFKGFEISDCAKSILCSSDFKPTKGTTIEVAVLRGNIFNHKDRISKNIRAYAAKHQFLIPNAEISCLIRENFSNEEIKAMGFYWIATMHEPIKDSNGSSMLLGARRCDRDPWLRTIFGNLGRRWRRSDGFAFVVSSSSVA